MTALIIKSGKHISSKTASDLRYNGIMVSSSDLEEEAVSAWERKQLDKQGFLLGLIAIALIFLFFAMLKDSPGSRPGPPHQEHHDQEYHDQEYQSPAMPEI